MAGHIGAKGSNGQNTFGKRLKEMRLAKGISLKNFAAELEAREWVVPDGTWGCVKAGKRLLIENELVLALKVLGAKVADLD